MEIVTGPLTSDQLLAEIGRLQKRLLEKGYELASLTFGGGCLIESVMATADHPVSFPLNALVGYLVEQNGVQFQLGANDLVVDVQGSCTILLCEAGDIHFESDLGDLYSDVMRDWAVRYPEAYELERADGRFRPVRSKRWKNIDRFRKNPSSLKHV